MKIFPDLTLYYYIFCMNLELQTASHLPVQFSMGFPDPFRSYRIPGAETFQSTIPEGILAVQQVQTGHFIQRHFLFQLNTDTEFQYKEKNEGLQSLLCLKGGLNLFVNENKHVVLAENQFTLMDADAAEVRARIAGGSFCSLWNTYYHPNVLKEYLPLLPALRADLKKAAKKALHIFFPPKPVKFTVHDAIQSILHEKYHHALQQKYIENRLKDTLMAILEQTYTEGGRSIVYEHDRMLATAALTIALEDINQNLTLEEIASRLATTEISLRRAFAKVYGGTLFKAVRKVRMEKARALILQGRTTKDIAWEMGMTDDSLTKAFKNYFHYSVADLKRGLK